MTAAHPPFWIFRHAFEISWKACGVLMVWGVVDFVLQRRSFDSNLRMSKQDVKDENKETDGNPAVKRRIRQLQRQMRRRRSLKDVPQSYGGDHQPDPLCGGAALRDGVPWPRRWWWPKAATAWRWRSGRLALWHGVPIVENRPLAQLLYRTVEEGPPIPAKLFVAVAEILAFVFQMQARARRGTGRRKATNVETFFAIGQDWVLPSGRHSRGVCNAGARAGDSCSI